MVEHNLDDKEFVRDASSHRILSLVEFWRRLKLPPTLVGIAAFGVCLTITGSVLLGVSLGVSHNDSTSRITGIVLMCIGFASILICCRWLRLRHEKKETVVVRHRTTMTNEPNSHQCDVASAPQIENPPAYYTIPLDNNLENDAPPSYEQFLMTELSSPTASPGYDV